MLIHLRKIILFLLPAAIALSSCSDDRNKPNLDTNSLTAGGRCLLAPQDCSTCSVRFNDLSLQEQCYFFDYCDGKAPKEYDLVYDCLTKPDTCDTQGLASYFPELSSQQISRLASKSCASQPIQSTCSRSGVSQCSGKSLYKCNGQTWNFVKDCEAYCDANHGVCTETLPACKLKPGVKLSILRWTDGDTLWAKAVGDGSCNAYEYTNSESQPSVYTWKPIRYNIRVHGIDAPECSKVQGSDYYYTCKKDTRYTNDNERMGYDAWLAAKEIIAEGSEITVSCDSMENGQCGVDDTDRERFLIYLGYTKNNASYDFSTEMARRGMAFPFTEFSSSKLKAICNAKDEARRAKAGVWSLGDTDSEVYSKMGNTKQGWLKNMNSKCTAAK